MTLHERFDARMDEFLQFDRIPKFHRISSRMDLSALMYLDRLFPATEPHEQDLISGAEHEFIYLGISDENAAKLDDEDIVYLLRCGVLCDRDTGSLGMHV